MILSDDKILHWLKEQFNIVPKDITRYRMAITTRQYQVLEFFGDAILDFIVSEYLIESFPIDQPGWFTKVRSRLVEEKNLSLVGKKIGLSEMAIIPSTSSKEHVTDSVVSDMVEAVLGAIYLDQGMRKCREVIENIFQLKKLSEKYPHQDTPVKICSEKGVVSSLQEFLAKKGFSPPDYETKETENESRPFFQTFITCSLAGQFFEAKGEGRSKKESKEKAAEVIFPEVIQFSKNFRLAKKLS